MTMMKVIRQYHRDQQARQALKRRQQFRSLLEERRILIDLGLIKEGRP